MSSSPNWHYESPDQFFRETLSSRPLAGNHGGSDVYRRPQNEALQCSNIQHSPDHQRSWVVVDIDRPNLTMQWEDKGIVPPNFISINPDNGHAHGAWRLQDPVANHATARRRPIQFLGAVRRAMTNALDGDFGYSNYMVKNPLHPRWRTMWFTYHKYTLEQLAEPFDALELRRIVRPLEAANEGRNTTLFDALRHMAYRDFLTFKKNGGSGKDFFDIIEQYGCELNKLFAPPLPLSEVRSTARSVAKWVSSRFTPDDFRVIQTERSQMAAVVRRNKYSARQEALSRRLSDMGGLTPSPSALAKEFGVSRQTIHNHINAIRSKRSEDNERK